MLKEVISHIFYEGIEHHKHLNLSIFTTKFQYNMLGQLKTSSDWFHIYALRSILSGSRSLKQAPSLFLSIHRSSASKAFLGKGVRKICSKFTGEQPCQSNLLKTHFGIGVLLWICCIFSEYLLLRTPLERVASEFSLQLINSKLFMSTETLWYFLYVIRERWQTITFFFFNICSETCCKYEIRRLTWL